ncbi:MAG: hypothetical protein Q8Q07_05840 [Dehalococcoidales bacterium]|nr:hypothetical protein [Dehalococcoidales bacterium]
MLIWWQYTVTFVGSLIVALISVWFSQWLSVRREYRKALENLRSEVSTNIDNIDLISRWIDTNLDNLKENRVVVATCPHLYESAWISVRGAVSSKDYDIAQKMEGACGFLGSIHDLMHAVEELKWGAGSAMTGSKQSKTTVFEAMKEIINKGLLPNLTEVKTLLDRKLG